MALLVKVYACKSTNKTPNTQTMTNEIQYIPDSLFPTDNDFEVPSLRLDMAANTCEIPFVCFGEQKRTFKMNGTGTLHFYTDDYRFNSVYDHPEKILQHNPNNIVEPNFSLFNETPIAFGLQAIYKKRTIARQMQEKGIRVFVDLNVSNKFYAYNLLGVPRGYNAFCTRGYEDRINALEFEFAMAKKVADGNELTFVVYGGGERVKEWCKGKGVVYVTPVIIIKNKLKALQRMAKNTALFKSSYDMGNVIQTIDYLFREQVIDNRKKTWEKQVEAHVN